MTYRKPVRASRTGEEPTMKRAVAFIILFTASAAYPGESWEEREAKAKAYGVYGKNEEQVLLCRPERAVLRKAGEAILLDYTVTITNPLAAALREFQGSVLIKMRHGADTVEFYSEFFSLACPLAPMGSVVHSGTISLMTQKESAESAYNKEYFEKNVKRFHGPDAAAVILQVNSAGPAAASYSIFWIEFADGFKWDWGK